MAPATFMLVIETMARQGTLVRAAIPDAGKIGLWCAAGAALLAPLAIHWHTRSSVPAARLLPILTISVLASVFGAALSMTTGQVGPTRLLGFATMLSILGWSQVYRECFRGDPLGCVSTRFTIALALLGLSNLAYACLRIAVGIRTDAPKPLTEPLAFMIFFDIVAGTASLLTARLRRTNSPYARSATITQTLLQVQHPILGTLVSLYWLLVLRKQELTPSGEQRS